jgi:hypothetical protein
MKKEGFYVEKPVCGALQEGGNRNLRGLPNMPRLPSFVCKSAVFTEPPG